MSTLKTKDNDLASLESSLAAIEQEPTGAGRFGRRYGIHPGWVYYYICFLGLFLFLTILGILNFAPNPEEPVFLSLEGTPTAIAEPPLQLTTETVPVEEPIQSESTEAEPKTTAPAETIATKSPVYNFFTPEELQKISAQIFSDTSESMNIVKAEVYSFLGWYSGQQKFKKDGMDYANRGIQANSQDPRAQRAMALAYISNGQYEKAKPILAGLKQGPDSLKDWMDGFLQIEAGRVQTGMSRLEQVRANDPSFYPASYILLQQYLKQNQATKAAEIAQFWKRKGVTNLAFVHLMTTVLDSQQQYVELVNYLSPLEASYPKDWATLFHLGKGNTRLQKREVAKNYFKKILDASETYTVEQISLANFELGKIALYENNFKESIQYLTQATQRMPNDSNIRFYLASAYFKDEDYEKAIEVYQQMLLKDQNDPKIRIYLGMAYYELGQYLTAEKNLALVLNQGNREPLLLYYLAKVEDQKGNPTKAKEYLQQVLSIEPKHPLAGKLLEKLNSTTVSAPAEQATVPSPSNP